MSKSLKRALTLMLTTLACVIVGLTYSYLLAVENFEPVMQSNYYETGLDYQKVLNATKKGKSFDLQSDFIKQTNFSAQSTQFILGNHKEKIHQAKIIINFEKRASILGKKTIVARVLKKTDNLWKFQADIPSLPPGQWEVSVKAQINQDARIVKTWSAYASKNRSSK